MRRAAVCFCLALAVAVFMVVSSCQRPQQRAAEVDFPDPSRRPSVPVVLVLAPPVESFAPVLAALRAEASTDFDVLVRPVWGEEPPASIGHHVSECNPAAVVLFNNPTVLAYRRWAIRQKTVPPALILMAAFADQLQRTVPHAVAISYETPAVTAFVGVRATFGNPVRRAGVVARPSFSAYLRQQRSLAAVEEIELVVERVTDEPSVDELRRALERLDAASVDVLWVLNDNRLLTAQLVERAWLPFVGEFDRPIVVGVPSLVRSDPSFGTYAAIPDLDALGVQAADIIFELANHGFQITGSPVRQPWSVRVMVDKAQAMRMGLTVRNPRRIDIIVE